MTTDLKKLPAEQRAAAEAQITALRAAPSLPDRQLGEAVPLPPSRLQESDAQLERESKRTTGDYFSAITNQDLLYDGLARHFAGLSTFDDQPGYSPLLDPNLKELERTVRPDLVPELYSARSPSHLLYLHSALQQKAQEQEALGDLGWKGTLARFAIGGLDPANFLTGYVGGVGFKGITAYRLSRAAAAVKGTAGAGARVAAEKLAVMSKAPSYIGGAAAAATENIVFEKVRQNVNFEDSAVDLVFAGAMGIGFAVPFMAIGARNQRRLAGASQDAQRALRTLADIQDGRAVSDADKAHVVKVFEESELIRKLDTGEITPDEFIEMREAMVSRADLVPADENITLGGTAKDPRVTTDAPTGPSAAGLEVTDGAAAVENIDAAPAPVRGTDGLVVDEIADPRGVDVKEADDFAEFFSLTKQEPPKSTALGDKLAEALGVKRAKDEAAAAAAADRAQKDAAFARAEQDAATSKERDLTRMQAERELGDANALPIADSQRAGVSDTGDVGRAGNAFVDPTTLKSYDPATGRFDGAELLQQILKASPTGAYADVVRSLLAYINRMPAGKRPKFYADVDPETGKVRASSTSKFDPDVDPSPAHYDPNLDAVFLGFRGMNEGVVVHETVHALTSRAIHLLKPGDPMVKRLHTLLETLRADPRFANKYGLTDVHEMMAEGFSSPEFRRLLSELQITAEGKKVNAFRQFVDMIRKLLGMDPKAGKALDVLMSDTNALMGKLSANKDRVDAQWDGKFQKYVYNESAGYAELVPNGFTARSSVGSAGVAPVQAAADAPTRAPGSVKFKYKGEDYTLPTRFDYFSLLNRSRLPETRRLAFDLIKDALQNDKAEAQGRTASEYKALLRRTIMGEMLTESKEAFVEAAKIRGKRVIGRHDFSNEFYDLVTRVTTSEDGGARILADNADIAPMLQRSSQAQKKMYQKFLEEAKRNGVEGADQIDINEFYVNRVVRHDKLVDLEQRIGNEKLLNLIASSIKDPEFRGDVKMAAKWLNAMKQLQFSPLLREVTLGRGDAKYIRAELAKAGVSPDQIDDMLNVLMKPDPRADAGRPSNLKYRWQFDENHVIDGVSMRDMFENDSRVLADMYSNSIAGHIGLASVGIKSNADWSLRRQAVIDAAAKTNDPRGKKELQWLDDIHAHITGKPMSTQHFDPMNRIASALRGYTRATTLVQLGITSAFELKQSVALFGFRAALKHCPVLSQVLESFRRGYVADKQLAKDMRAMIGAGNELAMSYARQAEVHEFSMDMGEGVLSKAEYWANRVSHTTDVLSGNRNLTSLTRNITAAMAAQHHVDLAYGNKPLTAKVRERLVGQGISDADIDGVLARLKEFSVVDQHGTLAQIKYDEWNAKYPDSYAKYQHALLRETRDAIQDHDIGETMPWMHTSVGKILGELRTFFFVAHAKNFLKNVSYRDWTAFQVLILGMVGEAMAYALQTSINVTDPQKLQERLAPDMVARAAFARTSALGMSSFAFGTGYELFTGESFTRPGMTANTDSRNMFRTPSVMAAQRLGSLPMTAADIALGRQLTEQQVRDAARTIPVVGYTWGTRPLVDTIASTMPKSKPAPAP